LRSLAVPVAFCGKGDSDDDDDDDRRRARLPAYRTVCRPTAFAAPGCVAPSPTSSANLTEDVNGPTNRYRGKT
jgi:hypothetical protein